MTRKPHTWIRCSCWVCCVMRKERKRKREKKTDEKWRVENGVQFGTSVGGDLEMVIVPYFGSPRGSETKCLGIPWEVVYSGIVRVAWIENGGAHSLGKMISLCAIQEGFTLALQLSWDFWRLGVSQSSMTGPRTAVGMRQLKAERWYSGKTREPGDLQWSGWLVGVAADI